MEIVFDGEEYVLRFIESQLPRVLQYSTARTLSRMAYLGRGEIPRVIDDKMTLRNKSFVAKSTRYVSARGSQSINSQVAYFGTVEIPRATGWIEQPRAGEDKRKRKWLKGARAGGTKSIPDRLRFKPGREILALSSKKGIKLGNLRREIHEKDYFNRPVNIWPNDNNIYPGVVKFLKSTTAKDAKGKKHLRIKTLATHKPHNVEKVDILGIAWGRIKDRVDNVWIEQLTEQLMRVRF